MVANFADAPGDLSRDGRSWTTVKDYVQWHDTARAIAGHIIDRYEPKSLEFTWSIFNEPDLGPLFWRAAGTSFRSFTTTQPTQSCGHLRIVDTALKRCLSVDSSWAGSSVRTCGSRSSWPTVRRVPRGGAAPLNAAFADRRLDGKRSRRVESLCRDHAGKGSPCDFVSVHSYNRSELMAAKLIRAKELALEIDPGILSEPVGQLARGVPRLAAAAR